VKRVEISLLGPPQVRRERVPEPQDALAEGPLQVEPRTTEPAVHFRIDSACALLAYLALHPNLPCRRETLAGLLWPDVPEREALRNLRLALYYLRQALDDPPDDAGLLHATRHTVELRLSADCRSDSCRTDVAAFEAAWEHRRLAGTGGEAALAPLAEAVELYRGDLLEGFSFPSALFEEWLLAERERLRLEALEALGELVAYHEGQGEHELTLRYARRQLVLDGWREEAQRQAMRALAHSGQRAAALAT